MERIVTRSSEIREALTSWGQQLLIRSNREPHTLEWAETIVKAARDFADLLDKLTNCEDGWDLTPDDSLGVPGYHYGIKGDE